MFKQLVDNSVSAALSAIEIYNKPNFKYRNEIFTILIINAWELLLKAKIVSDSGGKVESIYVRDGDGNIKTNRNNAPLTIEIVGAIHQMGLDDLLKSNLLTLLELRDTAIHFVNKGQIDYLVYSLGTACLKNYQRLTGEWFKIDLLEYNFYILPLGFAHPFKTFSLIDLDKEPDTIKSLLASIAENQEKKSVGGFHFTCEIEIQLKSAKKITEKTDLVAAIDQNANDVITIIKTQKLTDRYTLTYDECFKSVRAQVPTMKQNDFNRLLRERKIKEDEKYSAYNFRCQRHEEEFKKSGKVKTSTPSLYNEDCVRYLVEELPKFLGG